MAKEHLELIISTKGVRVVERQLLGIGDKAEKAGARAEKLGDRIDKGASRGAKSLQRTQSELRRTGKEAERAAGRANSLWKSLIVPAATGSSLRETGRALNSLAGRFAAFYTGRVLVGIADEFGRLNNILSGFGVAAGEIDKVRKSINDVANAARVDAVQAATLFGRLRQATKGLGLSSRELVSIVGTVNKALRLGGASSLEASQSIRQLSQAFNKGKLDGDEFRSVMENAPILQDLLTEKLGVTKDALFDLAAQGKITATDLVGAFQQGAEAIDEAYGNRITTLGDALTVLKNEFREAFGSQVSGPARVLAGAVISIARNMNTLIQALSIFASVKIFQAAIAGAKTLLATIKSINIQATVGAFSSLLSGKGAAKGDYTTQMARAVGKGGGTTGGVMLGLRGLAAGAGRLLPVVGQVAMVAALIPVFVDLIKAVTGLGNSAQDALTNMSALDIRVRQASLVSGARNSRKSMPGITEESLRKDIQSASLEKEIAIQPPATSFLLKGPGEIVKGAKRFMKTWNAKDFFSDPLDRKLQAEAMAGARSQRDRSLSLVPEDAFRYRMGRGSLEDLTDDQLRKYSEEDKFFDLFDDAMAVGGTVMAPDKFSKAVGRELGVETQELEKVLGESGMDPAKLIPIWRDYKNAIPLTEQEKLGDSFNQTKNQIAEYQERLDLLKDTTQKFKGTSEDLANAKAHLAEKINALKNPLEQENLKLQEQIDLLGQLKDVDGARGDVGSLSGLGLSQQQLAALAEGATLEKFLTTMKGESLEVAIQELDTNIRKKSILESLLEPMRKALKIQQQQIVNEDAIVATLERKRAELNAIGKTQAQQERTAFQELKPSGQQLKQFDQLTLKSAEKSFSVAVESQLQDLKDIASRIQQIKATGNLSEDQSKKVETFLNSVKEQAAKLGATIGRSGQEGSVEILQDAAEFLKTQAGEVGRILGAALSNAFNNTVRAGVGALGGSSPGANVGDPAYNLGGGPASRGPNALAEDAAALNRMNEEIQRTGNSLAAAKDNAQGLLDVFSGLGSISAGPLKQLSSSAERTANDIQGFFESAFGTLEDALVEFVTTGEFDFKKFINAIIADLARLVIRMLIIRPLMNFFGGIFGFGFANGGLVGEGGTLKKFSNGGQVGGVGGSTSDNQLIMASAGEFVVTKAGVDRAGINNLKHLNAGGSLRSERRTVGSSTINFAPQITVINEGGSGQDGQQQGEQIGTMVRQSFTELLMKETRPGGMLESVNRKGFA